MDAFLRVSIDAPCDRAEDTNRACTSRSGDGKYALALRGQCFRGAHARIFAAIDETGEVDRMSTRRTLIAAAGAAWLATPNRLFAQATAGKRRVAFLSISSPNPIVAAFTTGLRELGWVDGSNPQRRRV